MHAAEVVPPDLQSAKMNGPLFLPTLGGGNEGDGQQGGAAGSTAEASTGSAGARPQRICLSRTAASGLGASHGEAWHPDDSAADAEESSDSAKDFRAAQSCDRARASSAGTAKPVMKVQSGRLAVRPVEKIVRAPKLSLPVAEASAMPDLTTDEGPMPQAPPPKPIPQPARPSDVPVNSRGQQGMLVLNAIPPPPDVIAKVPLGESRSLFAVAPGESTVIADPSAGSKGGGANFEIHRQRHAVRQCQG